MHSEFVNLSTFESHGRATHTISIRRDPTYTDVERFLRVRQSDI